MVHFTAAVPMEIVVDNMLPNPVAASL